MKEKVNNQTPDGLTSISESESLFEGPIVSWVKVVCDCHTGNTGPYGEVLLEELGILCEKFLEHLGPFFKHCLFSLNTASFL